MALLTREQFLAAAEKSRTERLTVHVPELGGEVLVGDIGTTGRDVYEQRAYEQSKAGGGLARQFRALFVSLAVMDEAGKLLFTEADIAAIAVTAHQPIDRIFQAAWKLNKMDAKSITELEKNSGAGLDAGSSSSSPESTASTQTSLPPEPAPPSSPS